MMISFGEFASQSLMHSAKSSGVLMVAMRMLTSLVEKAGSLVASGSGVCSTGKLERDHLSYAPSALVLMLVWTSS